MLITNDFALPEQGETTSMQAAAPPSALFEEYLVLTSDKKEQFTGAKQQMNMAMKEETTCNFKPPAGWREDRSQRGRGTDLGSFEVTEWHHLVARRAKIVHWDRGASFELTDDGAKNFQEYLKNDPGKQLKGEKAESDLAEVLGNGVYDNEGNFETVSLHTKIIDGKKVLVLEADWKEAQPPMRSYGVFIDTKGDGKHIDQVWFIAPAQRYAKLLPEAKRSIESIKLK
jgi:hypothetical protein